MIRFYHRRRRTILQEPIEEFYGDTIFMFLDPFGYEWKIAQTVKTPTPREVIEASGLSGFAKEP